MAENIVYSAYAEEGTHDPLGTIALVMSIDGCSMWRFTIGPDQTVDLALARRCQTDIW